MKYIRNLSLLMVLSMVLAFSISTPVQAQDNIEITPHYDYTNKTVTDLNISRTGTGQQLQA